MFDNTKTVKFHEKDYDRILAVISSEGEAIEVRRNVRILNNCTTLFLFLSHTSKICNNKRDNIISSLNSLTHYKAFSFASYYVVEEVCSSRVVFN